MITKELLSAVLGVEIIRVYCSGHWVVYWTLYKNGKEKRNQINIYELALSECVKWLNSKGYDVVMCSLSDGKAWVQLCEYWNDPKKKNKVSPYFHGKNIIESIFKAGQYILEQGDKR
jgi:hypothetical protein